MAKGENMRVVADAPSSDSRPRRAEPPAALAVANENSLLSELQFLCAHTNKSVGTGDWTDNRALALEKREAARCVYTAPIAG